MRFLCERIFFYSACNDVGPKNLHESKNFQSNEPYLIAHIFAYFGIERIFLHILGFKRIFWAYLHKILWIFNKNWKIFKFFKNRPKIHQTSHFSIKILLKFWKFLLIIFLKIRRFCCWIPPSFPFEMIPILMTHIFAYFGSF